MNFIESLARHREELAKDLKRIRIDADVSGSELARRLTWSQSRISRIETGRQVPTEDEVRDIARELRVPRAVVDRLLAHLEGIEREWNDVRQMQAFGSQHHHEEVKEIEAKASEIFVFQQTAVPGLLQIPDYMRSISATQGLYTDSSDVESNVDVRTERQKVLGNRSKRFTFIMTESALWNRYGSGEMMHRQYDHLKQLLTERAIGIGIISRFAKLPLLPLTSFNIFDHDLVAIETITSETVLRHPSDVADYRKMFDSLSATAVTGQQAKRILNELDEAVV